MPKFFKNFWYSNIEKKHFTPNEKDVRDAKNLAIRLKGRTDSETLNNILEWQERNLSYWWERFLFDIPRFPLLILALLLLVILSLPFQIFLFFINKTLFFTSLLIIIGLTIAFFFSRFIEKIYYLLMGVLIVYLTIILLTKLHALLSFLPYILFYFGVLFIFGFIIYYLYWRYDKLEKKSFFEIFEDTFKFSLEVEKILKYKMAICRDYAKLTAALLLNLYPKNRIFFFTFPGHVATGIELNEKIYILDQKLPIVNIEAWLNLWDRDEVSKLELKRENNKIYVKYLWKEKRKENVKVEKLKNLVEVVEKAIKEKKKNVAYVLKNKAKIYDINNEIIKDSLLRYFTLLLQREFTSNFSKIKKLNITKKDCDLILRISLR